MKSLSVKAKRMTGERLQIEAQDTVYDVASASASVREITFHRYLPDFAGVKAPRLGHPSAA